MIRRDFAFPCPLADERGSVILVSIVLVFVMTLLGLALFELGAIENRMSLTSAADARAFEVAQAGLERALRELQDGFDNDTTGSESWADNDGLAPVCSPSCVTTAYRPMTLANTSFPGGGSYAVEIMLITMAQANATSPYPIGLSCFRDASVTPVCTNLVFVRSTGTVTDSAAAGTSPAPAGYTARKTIQTVARAYAPSVFANGLVAGSPPSLQPVNGNVEIAGSMQTLGSPVGALPAMNWNGAGAGIRNSLGDLGPTATVPDAEILRKLPLQQAVCAPTATPCATPDAYSLGAEVMVARPTTQAAITLAGSAFIGGSVGVLHQTGGTATARLGKGPLDAIYVADGCQTSACSDSYAVTSPSQPPTVDLGAIGRAFPENPVSPFPLITSPIRLGTPGVTYPGGLQEYLLGHAVDLTANLTAAGRPANSPNGLFANQANWSTTNPPSAGNFRNKNGVMRRGRICWNRTTGVLTFGVRPTGTTTDPCTLVPPSTAADPLLVMNTSPNGWRFTRTAFATRASTSCAGTTQICYNGAAIIANAGPVVIEEAVTNNCLTTNATCTGEKFPTNDLMALITLGNIDIARATTNVPRVMGFFYAAGDFSSRSAAAGTPTRIVGGVAANRFCFGGGSATGTCANGTSNIPEFYQAPNLGSTANVTPAQDVRSLPEELLAMAPSANGQGPKHWRVESVPRLWLECRPIAPSATLPTTPTGVCGY